MECNKEEAVRAREIAERKFAIHDFVGAKKFLIKAQSLFPDLDGVSQMLAVVDVHSVAAVKVGSNETDWYGILQVEPLADDSLIRRQYRKLALLLHPDKNKSVGAEAAFKLVGEAFGVLSDKQKRAGHDIRCGLKVSAPQQQTRIPEPKSQFSTRYHQPPTHPNAPPSNLTFWTTCPVCRMQYQYLRTYLNFQLLCQKCNKPFRAKDMYAPPQNGANVHTWTHSSYDYSGKGPAATVPPAPSFSQQDFFFPTHDKGNGVPVTGNRFAGVGVGSSYGYVPPTTAAGFAAGGVGTAYSNVPPTNATGFAASGVGSSYGNVPPTNAAGVAAHVVQETFQKVRRERMEAEREAKRKEREKERDLRRQEKELLKKVKEEARIKEALAHLLAKRKDSEAKQKVTEKVVPKKRKKKRFEDEEDDDDDDEDEDQMFQPATSGADGLGFSAPRRSRRAKQNVMYMVDQSDDDLEGFPPSRQAGMHMTADGKPNGEGRDGVGETNGEGTQKGKFGVIDGVEVRSNTGERMDMGVREMDDKVGTSSSADMDESQERRRLAEDYRRALQAKLKQTRIAKEMSAKYADQGGNDLVKETLVKVAGDVKGLDTGKEAQASLPKAVTKAKTVKLEVNVPASCTDDLIISPGRLSKDHLPQVVVPDSDFHDFDAGRTETDIKAGYFWAIYDDQDGMPRFYCRINKVQLNPFKVSCTWLESLSRPKRGTTWLDFSKLSPAVGDFKTAGAVDFDQINVFSHLMPVEKGASKNQFKVYPKTGEVWAVYRNCNKDMPILKSKARDKLHYEMVEIETNFSVVTGGVGIVSLIKLDNFKSLWRPVGPVTQVQDLWRFSHRVPTFRVKGGEHPGVPEDCWELDPASSVLS
ncbi:unnamed protein product [Sphagnum jensenii]|uniref:J domain-containing protein n=1 Tax=Sphagnum jensenii TaxID=128206 RepID=A0ABP0VP74_9BRYO